MDPAPAGPPAADELVPASAPGSTPITLHATGLSMIDVPRVCACCLRPAPMQLLKLYIDTDEMSAGTTASTLVGMGSALMFGVGWRHSGRAVEVRLRCPMCRFCERHEAGSCLPALVLIVVSVLGPVVTLAFLLEHPGGSTTSLTILVGLVLGVVAALGTTILLGRLRRGTGCSPHPTLRVAVLPDDTFKLVFGNRSWGQRVADLNPRLVSRAD